MHEHYRLSFTFGGLLYPETVAIARRHLELSDWNLVRNEAVHGELLRKTREASKYRYFREIRDRLQYAHGFEHGILAEGGPEGRHVDFALCCRFYALVGDFVREVIRDKIAMKDDRLGYGDYFHFLERKTPIHPELAELADSTKTKLRQVTFRMLAEGGLIAKGRNPRITIPRISTELYQHYIETGDTAAVEHLLVQRETGTSTGTIT